MVSMAVGHVDGVQLIHPQGMELVHQPVTALKGTGVDHDPLAGGERDEAGVPLAHGQEEQVHPVRLYGACKKGRRVRGGPGLAAAREQQEGY